MATIEQIKQLLDEQKEEIVAEITGKLEARLTDIDAKITTLTATSGEHTTNINSNTDRITQLENELKTLRDDLDDQVNRGMRNNIIIKGLPGKEDSAETKRKVVKILDELDNCQEGRTYLHEIERAHRMGDGEKDGRHIVVRVYNSELVKHFCKKARLLRMNDDSYKLNLEQQFSPTLTDRRNTAMLKRRELFEQRKITKGFVNYPAKLIVMYPGDTTYKVHEKF